MDGNITKNPDGSYQWLYEFSLFKNPTVLVSVFKVLLIAILIPTTLMFILQLENGFRAAFTLFVTMWFYGFLMMVVLMILAYFLISLLYGGKYIVLFKMDEKGVQHIQLEKQYKLAQAMGMLTTLSAMAAQNLSAAGAGVLGATRRSSYTLFKRVRSIKINPYRNTIYLNERLHKNQVYVASDDFETISEHIVQHCPKGIKIKYVR